MNGAVDKLILVVAVCVPLGVVALGFPALVDLVGRVEHSRTELALSAPTAEPSQPAEEAVPARRYSPLDQPPPPTLTPPNRAPTPTIAPVASAPSPTPTQDGSPRLAIYNTGGVGAVVRAEPVQGRQVASLREDQVVVELGRTQVNGAEWVRVRTESGAEGWVLGRVVRSASPAPAAQATPGTPTPAAAAQPTPSAARAEATPGTSGGRTHVVQRGDELRHIAARYGVSMASIIAANPIPNPDSLTVGQVLIIPDPPR